VDRIVCVTQHDLLPCMLASAGSRPRLRYCEREGAGPAPDSTDMQSLQLASGAECARPASGQPSSRGGVVLAIREPSNVGCCVRC
jgi:hypothetical protein